MHVFESSVGIFGLNFFFPKASAAMSTFRSGATL
jgi:hypothetical protein